MGTTSSPPKSVVQTVAAAGKRVLRSVNLLGAERPAGVPWKWKDPRKEYKFGSELGHGNYGVVHLVTHVQSGRIYACKILRNNNSKLQQQHIMAEVENLHRVDGHQNIATLHEVWDYSGYLYLIMEACLGGELFDVIMHRGHFSEKDAAVVARVILDVVSHCHQKGVAHRDLKPENFLLKRKALDPNQPLRAQDLRLVDFGLAICLSPGEASTELLGSPFYIAPEILKGSYGFPADLWSTGVILYILLSGLPPFPGNNERQIFQRILRLPLDITSEPWHNISADAKNLVSRLLERDPCKRITSLEGLKHAWLNSAVSRQSSHPGLLMERLRAFTEMSKLQGLLMNVIAKNMSTEGIGALQDVFDALDTNHDGYLSFEELRQGMEDASGESEACGRAAQAVMAALDVSGDGFIEYHEFLAAVLDRQQTLTDQTIAEMFALLDKNNDGKLSSAELRTALAESGIDISEATLEELMQDMPGAADAGRCSQGEPQLTKETFSALLRGTLESEEVMLAQLEGALSDMQQSFRMRNRFKQLAMLVIARTTPVSELQGLRELFQRLDVDNSGLLSLEELRRGLKRMDSELGEDEIEELLEYMDVDGNHMVDYHEFVMGTLEDKQLLTEAKLRAAFDYFDGDRNGYIDIGEVEKVVKELGIQMKHSPRDLLSGADANEDEVVDFGEFRDMMLSAEPNALTRRQQSLKGKRSQSSRSSLSSAGSCSHVTRKPPVHFSESSLQARHAAMPQDVLSSAIHEDLCGGGSAAAQIKSKLHEESEKRAKAKEVKGQKARKRALDISESGISQLDDAVSSLETHHRSKSSSIASRSLVNGSYGQELKRSGSDSQVAQPRRRRHLVFINSDHLSEDVAQEVSSRASTSEASSEVHTPQKANESSVAGKKHSKVLQSPFVIANGAATPAAKSAQKQASSQEHITANAAGQQLHALPDAVTSDPANLKAMLNFMEDQWSRASILALGKGSPVTL